MPGSLLLTTDAYSDLSETSGRSLDSKLGAKKVSFNKAVRVKQYPWKSDFEHNNADHLTLPSNRFWFKVYKNKRDTPNGSNGEEETFKRNAWGEESMESIHDTLAPIAEVEDQDLDLKTSNPVYLRNTQDLCKRNGEQNYPSPSNNYNNSSYHPIEPPVDYFDEMHLSSNNHFNRAKTVWETNEMSQSRYNCNTNHDTSSSVWDRSPYRKQYGIREEPEETVEEDNFVSTNEEMPKHLKLPRMSIRNDSPFRRSVRKFDDPDASKIRERRSRSHDDHLDNENRFKQLRKADKSVSTDDLNFNNDGRKFTNRFLRDSRDMATQCYGTLNRNKNVPSFGNRSISHTEDCETDRLNKFKSSTSSKMTFNGDSFNVSPKMEQLKKNNLGDSSSKRIRPDYDDHTKKNLIYSERNLSYKKHDPQVNGKVSNGISKIINRSENFVTDPIDNTKTYKGNFSRTDLQSNSQYESRKTRENTQTKANRDSVTIGYLRGRQIPLSEVNTNTNRKIFNRNESITNRNLFRKAGENVPSPTSPNHISKSDVTTSNGLRYKKFTSSNLENSNRRNLKNGSQSAKSYSSVNGDGDRSMIDWSLSGFQLATKPDNAITSVSDSEYTVHRRPPLLMYIPGVSHHDRPAIEDDRLSALSDLSRSEINDGLSSYVSNCSQDKNASSDIRRRYSMPRDGKLKWIKWKNKG